MSKKKHSLDIGFGSVNDDNQNNVNSLEMSAKIKKHRYSSIIITTSIILIMVIVFSVGMAFSWFAPDREADLTVITTSFSTELQYSHEDVESDYSPLDIDGEQIFVDDFDSLYLRVKYTGPSSAYIRVRLFENFNINKEEDGKSEMYPATDVSYNLADGWVKVGDYYYYKDVAVFSEETTTENGKSQTVRVPKIIPFVKGATSAYTDIGKSNIYMNLVAIVEAVQPDRFSEFFGFEPEELPAETTQE